MNVDRIQDTLEAYRAGSLPLQQAVEILKQMSYEPLGQFANLDHHRSLRTGFPEVIFSPGKTPAQIVEIFKRLADKNDRVLATRLQPEIYAEIGGQLPDAVYHPDARALILDRKPDREKIPGVVVVTAGTADIPVAEEAALTAGLMGNAVQRVFDVGVSGLHRLLDHLPVLQAARVIIVAAGMEMPLPSVVGGWSPVCDCLPTMWVTAPVWRITALLASQQLASGVAVMNIDNGYGAVFFPSG